MQKITVRLRLSLALFIILMCGSCATVTYTNDFHHISSKQEEADNSPALVDTRTTDILRVMTLNMAHGRGESFHQIFLRTEKIQQHLDKIADVIHREGPDLVALQEADGPSFWSGNFNHVEYLLNKVGMVSAYQGFHVQGAGLQYGTAMLANYKLYDGKSHRLQRSTVTLPKGFVVTSISWPDRSSPNIDVVSVHLDFLSAQTRKRQAREIVKVFKKRQQPIILMGDFNTDWDHDDGVIQYLIAELDLTVYQPEREDIVTLPGVKGRVDWILIGKSLEFVNQQVITDELSDHRAVIADISLPLTAGLAN